MIGTSIRRIARGYGTGVLTLLAASCSCPRNEHATLDVRTDRQLALALRQLRPGVEVRVAPGDYQCGHRLQRVRGTLGQPIVIGGADNDRPPRFSNGRTAFHLSSCSHITFKNIRVSDCSANGINIDDSGPGGTSSENIHLTNVQISDIGPRGNHDALKLSGVVNFAVNDCRFEGWGGSAIDMVGCRDGVIERCHFLGKSSFSQMSGVQIKGGSRRISVRRSFFRDCGGRAIGIGGATDLHLFRPRLQRWEAREVTVAGNRIVGGSAAIAWATAVGGEVIQNTIYKPTRYVLRILQETVQAQVDSNATLEPCQGGAFRNNLVVIDKRVAAHRVVNIGPGTDPGSFRFSGNAWFDVDRPDRTVRLPVDQPADISGVNPRLSNPATPSMASSEARLKGVGADSYGKAR